MVKVSSTYNLEVLHPNVAKEWHPTRNGKLTPKDVAPGSEKKVWWKCLRKGHEWDAIIGPRSKGIGCPYCSNRRVGSDNCLSVLNPKLAKEWHPTKNNGLTPDNVVPGSHLRVWWRCEKGHEWPAIIDNRAKGGGCPKCKPKTSYMELRIYSELKRIFRDVFLRKKVFGVECDIYIPSLKFAIEYDGVYWHKRKSAKDRKKNKLLFSKGVFLLRVRENGLRKISREDIVIAEKDSDFGIVKNVLNVMIERYGDKITNRGYIEKYLSAGKIKNNREFLKLFSLLTTALPGKSISDLNKRLAREWHPTRNAPLTPNKFTLGSNETVWWKCLRKGHEWQAKINNRANGRGCPKCGNKIVSLENNLLRINPILSKEWNYEKNKSLTPRDVLPNSTKVVWWRCIEGDEWQASVYSRNNGNGCPYCSNKAVNYRNCLATINPKLAKEWHPTKNGKLTPKDFTPGSDKKVWWVCSKGDVWLMSVYERTKGGGCSYCANKAVNLRNCLKTANPTLAKEWHPSRNGKLSPKDVVAGSHIKVWWRCVNGHEWLAQIKSRARGAGCMKCYINRVGDKSRS